MKNIILLITTLFAFLFFSCSGAPEELVDAIDKEISTPDIKAVESSAKEDHSFFISEQFDSLLIAEICREWNETDGSCVDNLTLNTTSELDSILVVESTCSCGTPCTVHIIGTFTKAGVPIDWMEVNERCDCPPCEGCGWSELNSVDNRTFIITDVSEEVIPKSVYDENGIEVELDCDVIPSYHYKTYVINNSGKFVFIDSYEESEDKAALDSLSLSANKAAVVNEKIATMQDAIPAISKYKTEEMSGKIWMIQNLNEATDGAICYNEDSYNCSIWGKLYTFKAAKNACTALGKGWRLPNNEDWKALTRSYGGAYGDLNSDGKQGYSLLSEGGSSGFKAKLGGKRIDLGNFFGFYDAETIGYYWSDEVVNDNPNHAAMYTFRSSDNFLLYESISKEDYISCRCVKDL